MQDLVRIDIGEGIIAVLDAVDFESPKRVEFNRGLLWEGRICDLKWHAKRKRHTTYVECNLGAGAAFLRLHRAVANAKQNQLVDHLDHDGLNNTASNLRVTDAVGNAQNRQINRVKTSRFKGVYRACNRLKWHAHIRVGTKKIYLGSFADEESAAHSYDQAARKHFGEFACVNFPRPGEIGCLV